MTSQIRGTPSATLAFLERAGEYHFRTLSDPKAINQTRVQRHCVTMQCSDDWCCEAGCDQTEFDIGQVFGLIDNIDDAYGLTCITMTNRKSIGDK